MVKRKRTKNKISTAGSLKALQKVGLGTGRRSKAANSLLRQQGLVPNESDAQPVEVIKEHVNMVKKLAKKENFLKKRGKVNVSDEGWGKKVPEKGELVAGLRAERKRKENAKRAGGK